MWARRAVALGLGKRMMTTASSSGAASRKVRLWPWVTGVGLVAGSGYYFFAGGKTSSDSDPVKTASDIINVSII